MKRITTNERKKKERNITTEEWLIIEAKIYVSTRKQQQSDRKPYIDIESPERDTPETAQNTNNNNYTNKKRATAAAAK